MNDDNNKKDFNLGALPPPGFEWEIGKTAATISFVREADKYLERMPRVTSVKMLETYVNELKSGNKVLMNFMTVKEYFNENDKKNSR